MTFVFSEVVISGTQSGVEGSSAGMQAISTAMQSMGWSVHDDRTDQAGSSMKLVLYNNQGEDATASGIYVVLTSGGVDQINIQLSSEWDSGAHNFGSGVAVPNTLATPTANVACVFNDENGDYALWISGDKDAVVIVSKNSGFNRANDYSIATFGRAVPFLDTDLEPYGAYLSATTAASTLISPSTTRVYGLVGNPVEAVIASQAEFLSQYSIMQTEVSDPRHGLYVGGDWVYTPIPILFTADKTGGVTLGAIGIVKHIWTTTESEAGGLFHESIMYDPVSGREYIVFASTSFCPVVRKT